MITKQELTDAGYKNFYREHLTKTFRNKDNRILYSITFAFDEDDVKLPLVFAENMFDVNGNCVELYFYIGYRNTISDVENFFAEKCKKLLDL